MIPGVIGLANAAAGNDDDDDDDDDGDRLEAEPDNEDEDEDEDDDDDDDEDDDGGDEADTIYVIVDDDDGGDDDYRDPPFNPDWRPDHDIVMPPPHPFDERRRPDIPGVYEEPARRDDSPPPYDPDWVNGQVARDEEAPEEDDPELDLRLSGLSDTNSTVDQANDTASPPDSDAAEEPPLPASGEASWMYSGWKFAGYTVVTSVLSAATLLALRWAKIRVSRSVRAWRRRRGDKERNSDAEQPDDDPEGVYMEMSAPLQDATVSSTTASGDMSVPSSLPHPPPAVPAQDRDAIRLHEPYNGARPKVFDLPAIGGATTASEDPDSAYTGARLICPDPLEKGVKPHPEEPAYVEVDKFRGSRRRELLRERREAKEAAKLEAEQGARGGSLAARFMRTWWK